MIFKYFNFMCFSVFNLWEVNTDVVEQKHTFKL